MVIDRGEVDVHVGVGHPDSLDTLGGADQAHQADVGATALLEHAQGVAGAAAGGEHRVSDDDETLLDVLGELAVINHRLVGLFVAVQADVADLGNGNELVQALYHTHTCAQDRDDGKLAARDYPALHRAERGLDIDFLQGDVTGDLVTHKEGDLFEKFAEILGSGFLVPHNGQLVLDHRVVDDVQLAHIGKCLVFWRTNIAIRGR